MTISAHVRSVGADKKEVEIRNMKLAITLRASGIEPKSEQVEVDVITGSKILWVSFDREEAAGLMQKFQFEPEGVLVNAQAFWEAWDWYRGRLRDLGLLSRRER